MLAKAPGKGKGYATWQAGGFFGSLFSGFSGWSDCNKLQKATAMKDYKRVRRRTSSKHLRLEAHPAHSQHRQEQGERMHHRQACNP
jgi:hypothetical protein